MKAQRMHRFVQVEGYEDQWFLFLEREEDVPEGLSERMQEQILRSHVCKLHSDTPKSRMDLTHRIIMAATRGIDYTKSVRKYGPLLVRQIGSYMPLYKFKIINEKQFTHFPIDKFGDIVICENDERSEWEWNKYLKRNYPNKSIVTINFFDLRSEEEVVKYFDKAQLVTFSTTFTRMEWFEKLTRCLNEKNKVIGYCHDPAKWKEALKINPNVTVVESLKT